MSVIRFVILFLTFILVAGCAKPKPTPDPLAGWTFRTFDNFSVPGAQHHYHLDKAIMDDYQDFIRKDNLFVSGAITGFYEDGTGQHAVEFEAFVAGNESWHYAIIYDKENKRVKVVKYGRTMHMS